MPTFKEPADDGWSSSTLAVPQPFSFHSRAALRQYTRMELFRYFGQAAYWFSFPLPSITVVAMDDFKFFLPLVAVVVNEENVSCVSFLF